MARATSRRGSHLRLVESPFGRGLPPVVTDPSARAEFEQLTQRLLDTAIEIMDLADGDHDLEPAGDEFEDDDGI